MVVHPRYLLGALEPSAYETYKVQSRRRQRLCYKAMSEMMTLNSLVRVKDHPPYHKELEGPVLLNSLARTTYNAKANSYEFTGKLPTKTNFDVSNVSAVADVLSAQASAGVGVDQGTLPPRHVVTISR